MELRPYQHAAVLSVWDYLQSRDDNPCVVIPTAGGKTPVMATLCRDAARLWGGRILILAHVKELLEQTVDKLKAICPGVNIGVYSAGLGKRQTQGQVIVAGIQSVYQKACDLGPFDLILIDEAHLLPPDGEGRYQTFLTDARVICPHVRVVGLTATPYRTATGMICAPDNILNEICFQVSVRDLIEQGYISKLINKSALQVDTSSLHLEKGEFVSEEAEKLMMDVVEPACREIVRYSADRRSVLVFCQSINHAERVSALLEKYQESPVELLTGSTGSLLRAEIIDDFKCGNVKYLVNVNVLTTGFDAPNIDCVALLRPTMSPGLFYQMVGRGFRLCEGKQNCLILDFGNNVERHGTVDAIRPAEGKRTRNGSTERDGEKDVKVLVCPNCRSINPTGTRQCNDCQYQFPETEFVAKHGHKAGNQPLVSSGKPEWTEYDVSDTFYAAHKKKGWEPGMPVTLRADHQVSHSEWITEWICVEHEGYANDKARAWWRTHSLYPFPESTNDAVAIAKAGGCAVTKRIRVKRIPGEKFPKEIVALELGELPIPEHATDGDDSWEFGSTGDQSPIMNEEDVPF